MTTDLAVEIDECRVPARAVRLWWLGQAGFAFKTGAGRIIYVDPYLWVVFSHEHTDHLDPDAIPVIATNNPACRFAGPSGCTQGLKKAGIPPRNRVFLRASRIHKLGPVVIHTAPADHGDLSPTALALVLNFDGVRVFFTGDTSWRPELFKPLITPGIDVLIPCINGTFGNMNHLDAARLAAQSAPRIAIPCHFWTFAEQGAGDPGAFIHACNQWAPKVKALLLRPGEGFTVNSKK